MPLLKRKRLTEGQHRHFKKLRTELFKMQPRLRLLRRRLLGLGGEEICLVIREEDLELILKRGFVQDGKKAKLRLGVPCRCHTNSARLWEANTAKRQIVTGWALSVDGIWRQHTWVLEGKTILETTSWRTKYFGYALTPVEAKQFAYDNL